MVIFEQILTILSLVLASYVGINTLKSVKSIIKPFIKIINIEKVKKQILSSDEVEKVKEDCIINRSKKDTKFNIDTKDKEDLFYYKEILMENATNRQRRIINVNYKDLDFSNKKELKIRLKGLSGYYNVKKNKIVIGEKTASSHETIHMSTSCYSRKYRVGLCGLHQYKLTRYGHVKLQIARGLNEACTNIKDSRIFNKDIFEAYKTQTIVVLLLEIIIGNKDDIQEDFNNMNLRHLLNRFKDIEMENEILEIIILLDATIDNNADIAYHYFLNRIVKRLVEMFQATNPTKAEENEFFNMLAKNQQMKKYVQKKSLYNYTDNIREENFKSY